jgi:hypothetical protein
MVCSLHVSMTPPRQFLALALPNDFIRPIQHRLRNRHANLLRRLQIDHELELRRLLDGKISRLGTFEDFVHIRSGAPVRFPRVPPVGYKPASLSIEIRCRNNR